MTKDQELAHYRKVLERIRDWELTSKVLERIRDWELTSKASSNILRGFARKALDIVEEQKKGDQVHLAADL
jgi:hypothetical protein